MNENKFEILTSAHSITTKLQDLLKQECITKIEIYCSDFADYEKMHKLSKYKGKLRPLSARIYKTLIDFVNHDHNDLPKDIIQVYSNRSFLQENLMDLINHQKDTKKYLGEKKGWFVSQKGILTQDQENIQTMLADYLRPIAQQARDNIRQYRKNLKLNTPSCSILGAQCAQDEFVIKNRDFSSLSELTKYFLDYSKNPKEDLAFLTNQLSGFQQKLTEILQHILDAEGIQKDIAPSLEEGFSHFLNHLQSIYDDGNIPYIKITITFLIQVIPALVDLAATRGLSTSWIDLATSIYDFSKKMWNLSDYQYAYTYMLPLYELFVQDIAPAFGLLGQKNLNNIIYIHTKNQTHFIDYSHYNPFMFELNLFSHFGYALYGSSHHLKTRYSSSSFSLEILNQDNIQKHLQKMFAQLHPRISFFSSPYFNSHKLIQWIKEQENNQKIQANYLILSQCPTKSNAGLSESLIQKLGYEIKDEINRTPQSPKLAQKPQDTYSPEVDYSKYEIKIDAKDNAPFVLSLSPFGFIPKETYQTLLQNKSVKAPSDSMFGGSVPIDQAKLSALDYLESFFQSQEQIQETIQKEQEIFEKEVKLMQAFLSSLGSLQSSGLFYTYGYQTHELILISLLIMAIQASYPDATLQTTKIQFEGQTLACGEKETFGTQSTRFAERQTQQVFEDLYLSFVPSTQKHTLSLDFLIQSPHSKATLEVDQLFEKLASLCEIEEDIESFGMFYLSHIQLCIHIFPFKAILSSLPSLDLYLFNALLSHPKAKQLVLSLERTFQIKANFQNKIEEVKEGAKLLKNIAQKAKEEAQKQNIDFNALIIQTLYEEVKKYPQNTLFQGLIDQWKSPSISIEILKPDFKGFLVALLQALMIECIDKLWINAYEQQKKAYEMLIYTRLRDKYHAPLALKREEGVYYPIKIFHTSLSFSFQNIILGGRFCTGGIGQAQGYFYKICQTQSSQVRNNNTLENFDMVKQYQLGMLFGLLCLDELRDAKTEEKTEDHIFFEQNHSKKRFGDYVLDLDNQTHKAIYKSYGGGSGEDDGSNQASAIDSYQVIMEYFDEMKEGISDSNPKENTPNPQKHRIAIRALDQIGKNNLRGLYVGIKEEQEQKGKQGRKTAKQYKTTYHNQTKEMQSRPKLIGRLATTIIMKDGLWIG